MVCAIRMSASPDRSHGHLGPRPRVCWHRLQGYVPIHVWVKHRLTDVPAVGKKVKNLKEGDRVAMEPGATCRVCDDCKRGRYEVTRTQPSRALSVSHRPLPPPALP